MSIFAYFKTDQEKHSDLHFESNGAMLLSLFAHPANATVSSINKSFNFKLKFIHDLILTRHIKHLYGDNGLNER